MTMVPGSLVHVAGVGKGVVREIRNAGRIVVEVSGRSIITTADKLTPREPEKKRASPLRRGSGPPEVVHDTAPSLDLHGSTVDEAIERVQRFLNDALLAGHAEVQIIHGRSGGRLKSALYALLKTLPSIRSFALDARNAGVTVVRL